MSGWTILTFNSGSSSIKVGVFDLQAGTPDPLVRGVIDLSRLPLSLKGQQDDNGFEQGLSSKATDDMGDVVGEVMRVVGRRAAVAEFDAVGHRVVHGGDRFSGPVVIDDDALADIEALVPLAPLHQPQSLRLIRAVRHLHPSLPQVASFDTAFHRTQTDLVRRFALPRKLFEEGLKRYGFHGLSYAYIASRLRRIAPELAAGRVVVAHLGSGASLCGMTNGISQDTSMSFSTLDGIPMSTRCGALDPGIIIHLIKSRGMTIDAVEDLLYHRSGLLGVSGLSGDTRELLASAEPMALEALDLFTFRIAREIAATATTLGGIDAVIFTAGIGEHQPAVRSAICEHLRWLPVAIDAEANARNATTINVIGSRIAVLVIPTDEEQTIAVETYRTHKLSK